MTIPAFLLQRIDEVIEYVGNTTSDYLIVKRQLINIFPVPFRSLFSARHPKTKKHILNDFDKAVIAYWEKQTGVRLQMDPSKLHDPEWQHKPKGWSLILVNEERRKRREEERNRQHK